jgi:endonuclease/exonuclease/phosphatase family metal-dependent hydrolase
MTWNVENLFRPAASADRTAQADYRTKLTDLAALIGDSGAELVALQEVGSVQALGDLLAELGDGWQREVSDRPDDRGIRVAWIARGGNLSAPEQVATFPDGTAPVRTGDGGQQITVAKRGMLAVTYTRADGATVRGLTAHFKSKLLTFPPPDRFDTRDEAKRARFAFYALTQRAAEAATARAWATTTLNGQGQHRNVLVTGDLNDTPDAATTEMLQGRDGSQLGTGGFAQPDWGDGNRLFNLAPAMPGGTATTDGRPLPPNQQNGVEPANWSRITNGQKELLDQLLVSHHLARTLHSTESLTLDGVRSATADPASLSGMTAPSDHRPVIARFNL